MRAALYARVSTVGHGQDPEVQLRELREHCRREKIEVVAEHVDCGQSGAKTSRPALDRLMAGARERRFDLVLVWKLDRFGRSLRHLVNALAELEAADVAFVSLKDQLDLTTPTGRLMFQIVGAMAEFERALVRERVCAGLRHARANGTRLGRPRVTVRPNQVRRGIIAGQSLNVVAQSLRISYGTAWRLNRETERQTRPKGEDNEPRVQGTRC